MRKCGELDHEAKFSHIYTQTHTHTKERASKALEFAIERHTKCSEVWKGFEYMTGI